MRLSEFLKRRVSYEYLHPLVLHLVIIGIYDKSPPTGDEIYVFPCQDCRSRVQVNLPPACQVLEFFPPRSTSKYPLFQTNGRTCKPATRAGFQRTFNICGVYLTVSPSVVLSKSKYLGFEPCYFDHLRIVLDSE